MNRSHLSILCVLIMLVTAVIPMTYSAGAENESNDVGDEDTNSCTGFYVGSEISADGTTIIGQTADNSAYRPGWYEHIDAVKDVSGRQVKGSNGFVYNLPSSTYGYTTYYTGVNDGKGSWGGSTMNDQGLAYTGAISANPNEKVVNTTTGDPFVKNGVSEEFLGHLVAMCCATADEAIDFIINLVKEHGITDGSIFMVSDQTKTWYIECLTGHQYVAIVLPEDKMATFGNDFSIRTVTEGKAGTTAKVSEDLVKVAQDTDSYVEYSEGVIDVNLSYAEQGKEGTSLRAWRGQSLFGGHTAEYNPGVEYPLLYSSAVGKVSVKQMMDFTRDRCKDTPYCPDTTGEPHRVVAVEFIVEHISFRCTRISPRTCASWDGVPSHLRSSACTSRCRTRPQRSPRNSARPPATLR